MIEHVESTNRQAYFSCNAYGHNRLFTKLFKTSNIDIAKYCPYCFSFKTPSKLWLKHINKLNQKIAKCNKMFVARFSQLLNCKFCKQDY